MLFNAFNTLFIIILLLVFKVHVLDEACKHHPHAWWWVKADGCDLVSGLAESVSEIWHGDVDLNNGELEHITLPIRAVSRISAISPWRHIQTGFDSVSN